MKWHLTSFIIIFFVKLKNGKKFSNWIWERWIDGQTSKQKNIVEPGEVMEIAAPLNVVMAPLWFILG